MKLYDYYRSTACYRVRIALNLKGVHYETINVRLTGDTGEHNSPEYFAINPQGLVPSLEINGLILHQSLAIIHYLEDTIPNPAVLPQDALLKAQVNAIALMIACDIHPLNNLRVLNRLKHQFKAQEDDIQLWYHHWLKTGFDAIEALLQKMERTKSVCCGSEPTIADICLIPQVYNAHRFKFPMTSYPLINDINDYCCGLKAFQAAAPQ